MNSPNISDLIRVFGKIGLLSFGGPAAQIALLQRETIDGRKWLDEETFLRGLSFCMMLPGPEAMQMATYIGWRLRGTLGGLIAGGLFVLPGAFVIAALAAIYVTYGEQPAVQTAFVGIKAAVLAIVVAAMARLARKALTTGARRIIAALAFVALFAFAVPFPVVVLLAALWGGMQRPTGHATVQPIVPRPRQLLGTIAVWGSLWAAPLVCLWMIGAEFLFELALFFGQLAITTFGGAYAVLAYMTQTVVHTHGWIGADQMMDALGLAETTPGPLILVTQFVGHVSGHALGGWPLWLSAGIVTLWMTFVPCFLWIFAGAPYLEALMSRPRIANALKAITAAVVGVMASLSLWLALNVLFSDFAELRLGTSRFLIPDPDSFVPIALICFALAAVLLWWRRWNVPLTLLLCTGVALFLSALGVHL